MYGLTKNGNQMEANTDMPAAIGLLPLTPAIDGGRDIGGVTTGMVKNGFAAVGEDNNQTLSSLKYKSFHSLYQINYQTRCQSGFFYANQTCEACQCTTSLKIAVADFTGVSLSVPGVCMDKQKRLKKMMVT
jgi:hypothetical protein